MTIIYQKKKTKMTIDLIDEIIYVAEDVANFLVDIF